MLVGVLALQGAFREHILSFQEAGAEAIEVRYARQLGSIQGLVIPGGESTTISKLLKKTGMYKSINGKIRTGMPVWGTCAGAVLLSSGQIDGDVQPFSCMDIEVSRNAYGRQVDSFEKELEVKGMDTPFKGVFIRAPVISKVGDSIDVLAALDNAPVAVRQGNFLATTFHPELTDDFRFHEMFIKICSNSVQELKSLGV